MALPLSFSGEINLEGTRACQESSDSLINIMKRALEAKSARDICISDTKIIFRSGWLILGTNVLCAISLGELEFQERADGRWLTYRIHFNILVAFCVLLSMIFALAAVLEPRIPVQMIIIGPIIVWLCIYGINVLITLVRFRRFLKGRLSAFPSQDGFGGQ